MSIIVIDPGDGGDVNVGGSSPIDACVPSGCLGKTVPLAIVRRLAPVPEVQGDTAVLTRNGDTSPGLLVR